MSSRVAGALALVVAAQLAGCADRFGLDETHVADEVPPCVAGTREACYTGPAGTEGVGPCAAGTRTCDAEGSWGACQDEVTPITDVCGNNLDEDCSGAADEPVDPDGDGFTSCGGDCCEVTSAGCPDPARINPAALDFPGDGVDDDCSGQADDAVETCDAALASDSRDGLDFARALELCPAISEADVGWGVLDARIVRADGTAAVNVNQHAIRGGFGATSPRRGAGMVVFSTGHAAATGDTAPAPGATPVEPGTDHGVATAAPADWLAAHGGTVPTTPGCPGVANQLAHDPVMLSLRVRTPSNARSFSVALQLFSADVPEFVCSAFNDPVLVLLDGAAATNPIDRNLAVLDGALINANLVRVPETFRVCGLPAACAPAGACGDGAAALMGSGYDVLAPQEGCGADPIPVGAATGWMNVRGNVVGGETITLRIALWDQSDGIYDTLVLLDDFAWSPDPVTAGATVE